MRRAGEVGRLLLTAGSVRYVGANEQLEQSDENNRHLTVMRMRGKVIKRSELNCTRMA